MWRHSEGVGWGREGYGVVPEGYLSLSFFFGGFVVVCFLARFVGGGADSGEESSEELGLSEGSENGGRLLVGALAFDGSLGCRVWCY